MTSLVALVAVLVGFQAQPPSSAGPTPAFGQEQSGPAGTQEPAGQGQQQAGGSASGTEQVSVDVDRIRKDLQRPDLLRLDIPSSLPEGSTKYKVQVKGYSFKLPTLAETLHIPWAPTPPGGLYNYEIMQMITPPEVRGSAPFSNTEMAWVAATSFLSALAMRELSSAVRGLQRTWRTWQEEQAYEEVQRELAEFLRQQAALKAGEKKAPDDNKPD